MAKGHPRSLLRCLSSVPLLLSFVTASYNIRQVSCVAADRAILAVRADVRSCGDPDLPEDYAYARVLGEYPVRSEILCLAACFQQSLCTHAAYRKFPGVFFASCVLFGGQMMRTQRTTDQMRGEFCRFLIMKPCANGEFSVRGFCVCPEGSTGQRCELDNSVDCLNRWTDTYSTNASGFVASGGKAVLRNISSTSVGTYAKVKVQEGDSAIIAHGTVVHNSSGYSLQIRSTLTKQAWNLFNNIPTRQFRLVREDGQVQTLDGESDSVSVQQRATTWYVRVPHVPRSLYAFNSSGNPLGTSVSDLLNAVINGQEILSYSGLKFNQTSLQVVASQLEFHIGVLPDETYITPAYWYNDKISTSGRLDVVRVFVSSENLFWGSTSQTGKTFLVEPCWTKATQDRLGKEMTVGYLIGAILHGHRTRIVVDDMALNVEQVLVIDSTVFFDAESFMQPADSITPLTTNPTSARLVVDSFGRVVACNRGLLPSWKMTKTFYNTPFLRWFIDTRPWSRVFTITTAGELLYGSESALFKALDRGASLQIGITMENSTSYKYFLLTIRSLQLTLSGHVVAEAEGLSRLHEAPDVNCVSLALLVTSLGEVRLYSYNRRQAGNHSDGRYMTVDWFVDSYLP